MMMWKGGKKGCGLPHDLGTFKKNQDALNKFPHDDDKLQVS